MLQKITKIMNKIKNDRMKYNKFNHILNVLLQSQKKQNKENL